KAAAGERGNPGRARDRPCAQLLTGARAVPLHQPEIQLGALLERVEPFAGRPLEAAHLQTQPGACDQCPDGSPIEPAGLSADAPQRRRLIRLTRFPIARNGAVSRQLDELSVTWILYRSSSIWRASCSACAMRMCSVATARSLDASAPASARSARVLQSAPGTEASRPSHFSAIRMWAEIQPSTSCRRSSE